MSDLCSPFVCWFGFLLLCSLDNLVNACYFHTDGHALTNSLLFHSLATLLCVGLITFQKKLNIFFKKPVPTILRKHMKTFLCGRILL